MKNIHNWKNSKVVDALNVKVLPNPNKGDFQIDMNLPLNKANTTLQLYNYLGMKVCQQDLGMMGGIIRRNVSMENKITIRFVRGDDPGDDARYTIKVAITK